MSAQKYTEARKNGNRKWDAANLDRLSLALPKGKKAEIQAHAQAHGESVNAFISRAIREKYLQCCRGVYPLNYFFSRTAARISSAEGFVSL